MKWPPRCFIAFCHVLISFHPSYQMFAYMTKLLSKLDFMLPNYLNLVFLFPVSQISSCAYQTLFCCYLHLFYFFYFLGFPPLFTSSSFLSNLSYYLVNVFQF